MNSQQLHSQGQDLQAKAASDRKQAERFSYNAQTYRSNGDETKATIDDERAQRLIAEAEAYENEAEQSFQASLNLDARAKQLDDEIRQIRADADSKIAEKEREKERLTGGGVAFF
jgi:hypothetical protein